MSEVCLHERNVFMYSRSYGSIETEKKHDGISIPANYNGSLYSPSARAQEIREQPEPLQKQEETPALTSEQEPPAPPRTSGAIGGLLEKFTAEDIILFVLVFSLLKEERGDPGTILAVILALLLL